MTSFVNYDDTSKNPKYKGDQLSKKYILEGGTLHDVGKDNLGSLRSGIGKRDGVYLSDIDIISHNGTQASRLYGIRPMPGITSAQIINKSAYGSLREATINFYAWDKHQLEELELLFMRTGYTVFFEWGWSQYLDFKTLKGLNESPTDILIKNFDTPTLNCFQTGLMDDVIYRKIASPLEIKVVVHEKPPLDINCHEKFLTYPNIAS